MSTVNRRVMMQGQRPVVVTEVEKVKTRECPKTYMPLLSPLTDGASYVPTYLACL